MDRRTSLTLFVLPQLFRCICPLGLSPPKKGKYDYSSVIFRSNIFRKRQDAFCPFPRCGSEPDEIVHFLVGDQGRYPIGNQDNVRIFRA